VLGVSRWAVTPNLTIFLWYCAAGGAIAAAAACVAFLRGLNRKQRAALDTMRRSEPHIIAIVLIVFVLTWPAMLALVWSTKDDDDDDPVPQRKRRAQRRFRRPS